MTCERLQLPDGGTAIVCTRGRRTPKCASCGKPAGLECDGAGCDKPLCAACAVSPVKGKDFCPSCCRETFVWWLRNAGGVAFYAQGQAIGRNAFRMWARQQGTRFVELLGGAAQLQLINEGGS